MTDQDAHRAITELAGRVGRLEVLLARLEADVYGSNADHNRLDLEGSS